MKELKRNLINLIFDIIIFILCIPVYVGYFVYVIPIKFIIDPLEELKDKIIYGK